MLEHFKQCVFEKKEASVVYLGGSITEGQGVDDKRLCWQGLLQTFMDWEWKECCFRGVNAGIGGTDSGFGAFRMERDVLVHHPDLLFVEFAVNDNTREPGDIRESLEGILYKLWKECPQADVIFVLTTTMKMAENAGLYRKDDSDGKPEKQKTESIPPSVQVHMQVAKDYEIACVNVGKALLEELSLKKIAPEKLLPDGVHPSENGYQVYYECLKAFLKKAMEEEDADDSYASLKASFMKRRSVNPYTVCCMVPAQKAKLCGFRKEHIAMCGRYGSYVSSSLAGSSLEFSFRGEQIGIFYTIACDSGDMEWSLDSGEWNFLSTWDTYALKFDRGSARMLAKELENREHVLRIRVKDSRAEGSLGNFIRISDFLVSAQPCSFFAH